MEGMQQSLPSTWHLVGWGFGQWLDARRDEPELGRQAARLLGVWGALGLLVFLLQRLVDGYGNFWLPRTDDTWWCWLQVTKYPPSLAFCGLELGLMALLLGAFFRFQPASFRRNGPLLVFGQVALFFFLTHVHLLMLVRYAWDRLEGAPPLALGGTWLRTLLVLAVLYPICLGYRRLKHAFPESLLRFSRRTRRKWSAPTGLSPSS
jgi:hypothetical protein